MRNISRPLVWMLIPMLVFSSAGTMLIPAETTVDSPPDAQGAESRGGSAGSRAITDQDLIWPMFGKDQYHTFIGTPASKGIYTPAEKWEHGEQIDSLGAAMGNFAANVFGVERNVNFVVYADGGEVYIVDGGTGQTAWALAVDQIDGNQDADMVYTSPALGDLNKNGKMDIVFAVDDSTNSSYVYAYEPVIKFNGTGFEWADDNYAKEQLWKYKTDVDMSFSSPVLADLDRNGNLDVIIGGADSIAWVFAINGLDGTALAGNWPYQLAGTRTSTPAIYEFGTSPRVVITSIEVETYYVYVLSNTGQTLHQKSINMNLPIGLVYSLIPSPAVGQLNKSSSNDEIVVLVPIESGAGRVYSLSHNLTTLWRTTYTGGQFESSPALADVDKDPNGDLDVIATSWDSFGTNMYAISGRSGQLIWNQYKSLGVGVQNIRASPALVDLSSDNNIDAVFVAHSELFALNGTNGEYLWNYTLPSSSGTRLVRSSPSVGEIDRDKFLDIFVDGTVISHYIIDLTLGQNDVQFSSDELIQGQEVSVTAIIHNTGQATAEDVLITFLENGVPIDNSSIPSIPGGDTRGATVQWTPQEAGETTLTIKVDPDNTIEEIVESNNDISIKRTVIAAYPDLTFDELKFYRGDGKQIDNINTHLVAGEESRIAAVVRNTGGLPAENIIVRFRANSVNLGVDQLIGQLGVNKTAEVGVNWTPNSDYHQIDSLVDPGNALYESNESNNNIREDALYVKSNNPGDASYIMSGMVLQPDGYTAAASATITFTNERTQNFIFSAASSEGKYSRDLKDVMNGYLEGDWISIFASDGTNESMLKFKAYSEDKGRDDTIILTSLPRYSVSLYTEDDALDVDPGSAAIFSIFV
ncbi:MAG: PQQ-binding-like beta-propeller repeat protein [Thermoplasmata archaeon]|nr:MAG: PQQ-binding-like beta-propeller repeat protein [Thermoplasmata archaeon]